MAKMKVTDETMLKLVEAFLKECPSLDKSTMTSTNIMIAAKKILEESKNSYRG